MSSRTLAKQIRKIGRAVNMDTLGKTRNLYTRLQPVAPFEGVTIHRDQKYGPDERNRLDLFLPSLLPPQPLPALIFIHGGGFIAGDKYTPGTPFYDNVGVFSVRNDLAGINITHRLAPKHQWPAVIEDIAGVIRWLGDNASSFSIDINRVFLMGQSAGAAHAANYIAHPEIYAPAPHGLAGAIFLSGIFNLLTMTPDEFLTAYFGKDTSRFPERNSLAGLQRSSIPLMAALAEMEPDFFERQTLEFLSAIQARDGRLPIFVHMIGHNHLSGILHLGLEGDLLGPRILDFIFLK
jgi:triacylglycerol lipase